MIAILLGIFLLQGKIFLFWFSDFHSTTIGMLRDSLYIPGTSMIAHSCFRRIHKMQSLVPSFNRINNPNEIFHWYYLVHLTVHNINLIDTTYIFPNVFIIFAFFCIQIRDICFLQQPMQVLITPATLNTIFKFYVHNQILINHSYRLQRIPT